MSKNKLAKLLLALGIGVVTAASGAAIVGCQGSCNGGDNPPKTEEPATEYTVTFNLNYDGATGAPAAQTVDSGEKATEPTGVTRSGYTLDGWYTATTGGEKWNFATSTVTSNVTLYAHWTEEASVDPDAPKVELYVDGAKSSEVTATKSGDAYVIETAPEAIEDDDATTTFYAWYTDENITQKATFPLTVTDGLKLYAGYLESVTSSIDMTNKNFGKFTLTGATSSTLFEPNSGRDVLKWANGSIDFTVGGVDNATLTFEGVCASSSSLATATVYKVDTDGTKTPVKIWSAKGNNNYLTEVASATEDGASATEVENTVTLEPGTYTMERAATVRVIKLELVEKMLKGTPESISVSGATAAFLVNDTFNFNGLTATLTFDNGRQDDITPYIVAANVDTTNVNMAAAGEYEVTVSYHYEKKNLDFTAKYSVKVFGVEEIHLITDKQEKNELQKTQQVYFEGDKFDDECYTVKIVGRLGTETHTFYDVAASHYTASTPDMTAGVKTFTVTSADDNTKSDSFKYYVLPEVSYKEKQVMFTVDKTIADDKVGTADSGGAYQFNGIQQAIDFIKLMNLDDGVFKVINIEPGTYEEKVEIADICNLNIMNDNHMNLNGGDETRAIIEYDAIHGNLDPSGTHTYESNDTATVSIRASAKNIILMGLTINNKYKTAEQAEEHPSDDQALALITENDQTCIMNCELNGYQDTVQFKSGRAFVMSSLITGSTDFIYGENSTVYFYDCEIRTVKSRDNGNGGYITAFKGTHNSDGSDAVKYGAIFDTCRFTYGEGVPHAEQGADETVTGEGATAIARAWNDYAKVAVINSELGGHISTQGYTEGTTKGQRYVAWKANENHPTDTTIEYVEYKNTGLGALKEAVNGMTMLTDDEVTPYIYISHIDTENYNMPVVNPDCAIFKKSNGNVTYADDWNPINAGGGIENYKLTVKDENGEEVGFIVVTEDEKLTADRLAAKVTVPDGMQIEGFYKEQTFATEFNFTAALTDDVEVFVKFEEKAGTTQSFDGATTGLAANADAQGKSYGVDDAAYPLFSVAFGTEGGNKLTALTYNATADDGSGLVFTQAFLPTGGSGTTGRSISITAKADIWITVYYTVSNGDFQTSEGYAKSGNLQWTIGSGDAQTSSKTTDKANNVAYSDVIALKAGETVKLVSTGNRIILFGITATDVNPNA